MSLVWDVDVPPSEKLVLLCYANYADQSGKNIYPAIDSVAKKTKLNRRTVQRATKSLEEKGLLIADGKGRNGVNKWRYGGDTVPPRQNVTGDTVSITGDTVPPRGVTPDTKMGDTVPPKPSLTVKRETSGEEERAASAAAVSAWNENAPLGKADLMLCNVSGFAFLPPDLASRKEAVYQLIQTYGEDKTREALEKSVAKWKKGRTKTNRPYRMNNPAWIDWAVEYLATGSMGEEIAPKTAVEKVLEELGG